MKLYLSDDMTAARQWAGTQEEANRLWGRNCWQLVDVPTDKPGLLAWLNAGEHVKPAIGLEPVAAPVAPTPAAAPTLAIDDAWDALPLARQLHFAALAMEAARAAIRP